MELNKKNYREPVRGYAKIPHCLYDIEVPKKIYAIAVCTFLCRRRNNKSGRCNPSRKDIARHLGISEKQVSRAISVLENSQIIRIRRVKGVSNQYLLQSPNQWDWQRFEEAKRAQANSP